MSQNTDQELNEAIARKMGWKLVKGNERTYWSERWFPPDGDSTKPFPNYSGDIAAAWEIWEFLVKERYDLQLYSSWDRPMTCFQATLKMDSSKQLHAEADTAPMAICLAFLKLP